MRKRIVIMTISAAVAEFYREQLYRLFGDRTELVAYSIEGGGFLSMEDADVYLVCSTSSDFFDHALSCVPGDKQVVISDITFTNESLEKIRQLPKGTKALLVNLSKNMAIETVSDLYRLGITNVELVPVGPEDSLIPRLEVAITPDEVRFVPDFVSHVINIGNRVFTGNTIVELAFKLGFPDLIDSDDCKAYIDKLAVRDYGLDKMNSRWLDMESKFDNLINAMDVGIVGIDVSNRIFAFNPAAEHILGENRDAVLGKSTDEALACMPINVFKDKMANAETRLITVKGTPISLTTTPIVQRERFFGYFVMVQRFSDEENRQQKLRMQLLDKGHTAKYTFEDIIGESPSILKAKSIAAKMAASGASILLTGESGTGKELFAHAIHKSSGRSNMPFVAVNCAALPDTLLESELFGYAEGSFTGAKKGGKLGLFEYAHKGTLFLDEIEGMSPNLQVKLLRVLQEKEVMRIGEDRIITVDVRIIAASNENIKDMVQRGTFRKDLYYRLNTLPIDIPPLRERGADILLIANYIKTKIGAEFMLTKTAENAFLSYIWDGNIRELRNIIEYLSYMEEPLIDVEDLPFHLSEQKQTGEHSPIEVLRQIGGSRYEEYAFVLNTLLETDTAGETTGRKGISNRAQEIGIRLSEQEVRTILLHLAEEDLVRIGKGRTGTAITRKGKALAGAL